MVVHESVVGRYFMTAVEERNGPEFARQATARGPKPR